MRLSGTSAGCALGGDRRRRADGELRALVHVRLDRRARRRHLPNQPRRPGRPRQHGPSPVVHGAGLGAARHRLRAADGLSGQAATGRPAPPAGGRRGAADGVAGPQDLHLQATQGLPLQRRKPRSGERVRARDQPDAGALDEVARRAVHAPHRRRRRRAGGQARYGDGRRGPRRHADRPLHARGAALPGTDDAAVLLRRAADAPPRRRGDRRLPDRRPLPRDRVPARRARRDRPEPVLRRLEAPPRRRLRRRPARAVARRADQAHRARRGGLDHQPDAGIPEPGARADGEVRHQSLAVLLPARAGSADARLQLLEAALPEQPGVAQSGEFRARPAGAAGDRRRPLGGPAHRPVHPLARARAFATGTSIHWRMPIRSGHESWRAATSGVARRSSTRATSASPSPSRSSRSSSLRRSGSRSRSGPCGSTPPARRTSTCSRSRVRSGTSHSWSGRRTCPTRRPISTCCWTRHHIGGTNVAGFTSAAYDRALRRAARVPQARSGNPRTGRWTYRLRATPRRSPRSAFSTNRPSSPNASAASCCDRRSCSLPCA